MAQKQIQVAINGFGRIGRLFLRQAFDNENFKIKAINDLGDGENLAYLFKYDTVYGRYNKEVIFKDNKLKIGDEDIVFIQEKDPTKLPWGKLDIDVVVESTGVFESYEKAKAHLEAGAKRVIITAPAKDPDGAEGRTVLVGVNESDASSVVLTSNGSCTTNAASPVISVMAKNPGVEKAILNTIHGYTATQGLVDGPSRSRDVRRGRAAAQNIVPSTTGAAIAVARAIKELEGKFDGIAMRVPVIAGSVADITFIAKRETSVEEVNDIFKKASGDSRWAGILKVIEDPIVSSDILGEPYGSIVDLGFTKVVGGNLVKVLAWYDNEYGYVATLIKHTESIAKFLQK
jgi:glyceraldehyde 3-phosphate dehydrogenase